jgi:hypothetical protein
MKLFIHGVTNNVTGKAEVIDDCVEKKRITIKCRYNDRGYCKSQSECMFAHSDKICENFVSNGKCLEPKQCLERHPKDCKHWKGDTRGCLRGDECKYLHILSKKGISIKTRQRCHKINNEKEIIKEKQEREKDEKEKRKKRNRKRKRKLSNL